MKVLCTMSLLFALAACGHLEMRSPIGIDLSGTWQLDERHSDSPPPLGRRSQSEVDDSNAGGPSQGGPPRFSGPMPLLPMVSATEMTIAQDPQSMGIDYPNQPYRDVKWGTQKRGLFTIDAGWDQQSLVIETKSQPLTVREVYSLSASGDVLTLQIDLNGKRMNDRHLKRVFTRKAGAPSDDTRASQARPGQP